MNLRIIVVRICTDIRMNPGKGQGYSATLSWNDKRICSSGPRLFVWKPQQDVGPLPALGSLISQKPGEITNHKSQITNKSQITSKSQIPNPKSQIPNHKSQTNSKFQTPNSKSQANPKQIPNSISEYRIPYIHYPNPKGSNRRAWQARIRRHSPRLLDPSTPPLITSELLS